MTEEEKKWGEMMRPKVRGNKGRAFICSSDGMLLANWNNRSISIIAYGAFAREILKSEHDFVWDISYGRKGRRTLQAVRRFINQDYRQKRRMKRTKMLTVRCTEIRLQAERG